MIEACLKALEKEGVAVEKTAVLILTLKDSAMVCVLTKEVEGFQFWSTTAHNLAVKTGLNSVILATLDDPLTYAVKVKEQDYIVEPQSFDSFAVWSKFFDFIFKDKVQGRASVPCLIMTLEAFEAIEKELSTPKIETAAKAKKEAKPLNETKPTIDNTLTTK